MSTEKRLEKTRATEDADWEALKTQALLDARQDHEHGLFLSTFTHLGWVQ